MGLFGKRTARTAAPVVPLGSGRRLQSDRGLEECLEVLDTVVAGYRVQKWQYLPRLVPAGYQWLASTVQPDRVVCCNGQSDDFLLVAMWRKGAATEIGLFPLGSGDARLVLPIVGHWAIQDSSLRSIGTFPARSIALSAPRLPDEYLAEALGIAALPVTDQNIGVVGAKLAEMFLIKAQQFISSQDPSTASRFVADHQTGQEGVEVLQGIIDDLASWNTQVLPYIQELPYRTRAILLQRDEDGNLDTSFWS